MDSSLEQYKILVEFLGTVLGGDYEVALHDLRDGNNTIIAIANGHVSGRKIGAPLTNLALKAIANREYERQEYIVGYQGTASNNVRLRSSTMFIKDDKGKPIGLLCINYSTAHCIGAANAVLSLCGLPPIPSEIDEQNTTEPATENFVGSVPDAVRDAIKDVVGDTAIPASRLTMEEKIQIVDELNQSGLFYLKGAVSEVAAQLSSSEATIYRYLSKLKN